MKKCTEFFTEISAARISFSERADKNTAAAKYMPPIDKYVE
jgi:hypothetical protein